MSPGTRLRILTWAPYSAYPIRNRETVRLRPAAGHGWNGAPYMIDGRFAKEERAHLIPLDAVDEVRTESLVCSKRFKEECMRRCHEGERPGEIFAQAGLPASLIGYKRIERAACHWKEAEMKGALTKTDAPQARHRDKAESIRRDKREAVERQRAIRAREKAEMEDRLARQKERARSREEKIIASQRAEIESLKAQVKALKALGALARRTQRAPRATEKSERFELIFQLREEDPSFSVSAACGALEVSRRGCCDWVAARPGRLEREKADLAAKEQVEAAFASHGSRMGSRQIVDCLARGQKVRMSRRKVQRIMRKFGIVWEGKRGRPCGPIGQDGEPKVAPNAVDRDFRRGAPLKAVSTDIACLPCMDEGFVCMSGILDCQTDVLLAQKCSISMEERLVLDTYDQLRELVLPDDIWACSDRGAHHAARACRDRPREPGIRQSMSRRACCRDNACIGSFWGRMEEQMGDAAHLPPRGPWRLPAGTPTAAAITGGRSVQDG